MKIVLAFDSFKGSIDSPDVCRIVGEKLSAKIPGVELVSLPMADGGENTASIVAETLGGGMKVFGDVQGPLADMKVLAGFGNVPDKKIAIVEVAIASGIALLDPEKLEPMKSSTFGTGQIMKVAMQDDYETIYLTLGSSATNDGGTGAAAALGWKFLDKDDKELVPCGETLIDICKVVAPAGMEKWPKIKALCDVRNPLFGKNGAAYIFGPQKGADEDQIKHVDAGLRNLAEVVEKDLGKEISEIEGAGAAGGFGGGAVAFMNAELVPGIETIMEWLDFDKHTADADWLITGEGCLDDTSFQGKVLSGISHVTQDRNVKLAAIAGRVKASGATLVDAGVEIVEAAAPSMIPDSMAFAKAEELLAEAAERVAERIANFS
ncbi:MAG: glycerate kinase [Lentisphaeraceae bacterium]|nr:glycerate kinase [Lentisphaeraceae bacterium]